MEKTLNLEVKSMNSHFQIVICEILNKSTPWIKDKPKINSIDVEDTKKNRWEFMKVLQTLEPREVGIIFLYDYSARSFREVGRLIGLTGNRVQQIRNKAYRKLRHPLRARKLKRFLVCTQKER